MLGLEAVRSGVCSMALGSQWSLLQLRCPRLPQILHSYQITHNIKAPFKVAGACHGRATVATPDDAAEATMGGTARCGVRATKQRCAHSPHFWIVPEWSSAVDGEFLQSALAGQIMLKEQLPKMLQEERTTVYVTPCIDNWLRLKGPQYSGALFIASKLAHLKCRHDKGFGAGTTHARAPTVGRAHGNVEVGRYMGGERDGSLLTCCRYSVS